MIPNVVHFIFTTSSETVGKPFALTHYMAIRSVYEVNRPDKICFHYQHEPSGEWWEKIKPLLTLKKIELPAEIFGNPLLHMAHQADVIRLRVLYEEGGIYMDMDTISVRSYHDLLNNDLVMGMQYRKPVFYNKIDRVGYEIKRFLLRPFVKLPAPGIRGLANTIIFAKRHSEFIALWLETYKTFRGTATDERYWDEHSVRMPYKLAKENPHLITMLKPETFYLPFYDKVGLKLLFEKARTFPDALIHHLWQNVSWEKYGKSLTPEEIRSKDTTYNLLARRYL